MARFQLYNPLLQRVQRYAETAVLFRSAPFPATGTSSAAPVTAVFAPLPQPGTPVLSTESQPPTPLQPVPQPSSQNDPSWRRLETILQRHQQKGLEEAPAQVESEVVSRSIAEDEPERETAVPRPTPPPPSEDVAPAKAPVLEESSPADAPLQPLPLDAAWAPVQKAAIEDKPTAHTTAAPPSPPIPPAQKANLEGTIQAKLADTHTAQPTQSAVEIHVPRRQRPDVAPPLAPPPPAPPRPTATQWVETDIGPLPSDLWGLIDEVPPTKEIAAPNAAVDQPPTIARQVVAQAEEVPVMRETAVSPLTPQPITPPTPPTAILPGEQERPFPTMQIMDDSALYSPPPKFATADAPVFQHAPTPTTPPVGQLHPASPVSSEQPAPTLHRQAAPAPLFPTLQPTPVPVAKAAPAHHSDMAVASPTIVQRFATPASQTVAPMAAPQERLFRKEAVAGATAVLPPNPATPPFIPQPLPEMPEEKTAVQAEPEPKPALGQQEVVVVERMAEERPLLQKMPLDAMMQPFLGMVQSPFVEPMLPFEADAEIEHQIEAADEPQENEAGAIEELAQHVYRQLRQRLATDWERRRTR